MVQCNYSVTIHIRKSGPGSPGHQEISVAELTYSPTAGPSGTLHGAKTFKAHTPIEASCPTAAYPNTDTPGGDRPCETILMVLLMTLAEVNSETGDVDELESVMVLMMPSSIREKPSAPLIIR